MKTITVQIDYIYIENNIEELESDDYTFEHFRKVVLTILVFLLILMILKLLFKFLTIISYLMYLLKLSIWKYLACSDFVDSDISKVKYSLN